MAGFGKARTTAAIPSGLMSPSEALAALQTLLSSEAETPAPGYLTMEGWAEAWGKSLSRTSSLIRRGMTKGLVEKGEFRLEAGKRKVPHYRVKA